MTITSQQNIPIGWTLDPEGVGVMDIKYQYVPKTIRLCGPCIRPAIQAGEIMGTAAFRMDHLSTCDRCGRFVSTVAHMERRAQ